MKYYILVHCKNEEGKVDALWETGFKIPRCMHPNHSGLYENTNAHDDTCFGKSKMMEVQRADLLAEVARGDTMHSWVK